MAVAHSTRLYRVVLDAYMVGDLVQGRVEWRARGAAHTQHAGDLVFGEPGELYASHRHGGPGTWHALFVAPALIEEAASDLGARGAALHLGAAQARDPALSAALARFHRAVASGEGGLGRDVHLAACVRRLVEHHAERRSKADTPRAVWAEPRAVRRAREYLDAHAAAAVSLEALAAAAGVSKYHLVRSFRRVVGVPPHAYQVQLRVAVARRLIAAGHPLSRVAFDAGFAAQSHLNRHFARVVGVTPGAYRRAAAPGSRRRAQDR
jgi:AraC-like DNA-binding protein